MWSAGQADDRARFLAELRALRDAAAVGYDELSARTHFPSGILKEAENGPALPTLPILAAYVRACEGDVLEWEERWRRLGSEAWADPNLPVRPPGASPAAAAGARAAVTMAPPDVYDPERIRTALRGGQGHADTATASRGAAAASTAGAIPQGAPAAGSPSSWSTRTGWDDAPQQSTGTRRTGWGTEAGTEAGTGGWDAAGALDDTTGPEAIRDWDTHDGQDANQGWGAGAGQEARQAQGWDAGSAQDARPGWDAQQGQEATQGWDSRQGQDTTQGWDSRQGQDTTQGWDSRQGQHVSSGWDGGTSPDGAGWFDTGSRGSDAGQYGGSRWDSAQNGEGAQNGDSGRSWDGAADAGANGNHHGGQDEVPFGVAATVTPDLSSAPESIWHDPFSASWLQDSELTAPPGPGTQGLDGADSQPQAQVGDTRPTPARTDAWASADRSRAVPGPVPVQEPVLEGVIAEPPPETVTVAAAAAQAPQAQGVAAGAPANRRSDRYYPLRLILVIVVAALIGSVLVLLLR
jgi:hypothetical protein